MGGHCVEEKFLNQIMLADFSVLGLVYGLAECLNLFEDLELEKRAEFAYCCT